MLEAYGWSLGIAFAIGCCINAFSLLGSARSLACHPFWLDAYVRHRLLLAWRGEVPSSPSVASLFSFLQEALAFPLAVDAAHVGVAVSGRDADGSGLVDFLKIVCS